MQSVSETFMARKEEFQASSWDLRKCIISLGNCDGGAELGRGSFRNWLR